MPIETTVWDLRKSGNQTLLGPPPHATFAAVKSFVPALAPVLHTKDAEAPLFPPGGVIPPGPVKYGMSECRYPTSPQNVMKSLGM